MSSDIPGERPSDFSQPRPPDGAGYGAAPTARPRRNGMGTAALVIGVIALVLLAPEEGAVKRAAELRKRR